MSDAIRVSEGANVFAGEEEKGEDILQDLQAIVERVEKGDAGFGLLQPVQDLCGVQLLQRAGGGAWGGA